MTTALLLLWTAIALFCGTAVASVRLVSRTRLLEELRRRGRESMLELYDAHEHEYGLTTLIYRQLAIVLFVITVSMTLPPENTGRWHPLCVLGLSAVWFIVVGVAIPTAWARHAGEAFIAQVFHALEGLRKVTRPLLIVIHAIDEIVRRLAGAPREREDPTEELEREIMDAVTQAETTGAMDETEKAMIESVMVLDDTAVTEIMTPRTDLVGVESGASFAEVRDLILKEGHSRIPVYEETLDHIVGILYAKDLLRVTDPASFSLREMMRPVLFVPETKDLASLLREFQSGRRHMAIVLDEYGGTAGLVTIEDILEELVGEITDEHEPPPAPPIMRLDDRSALVDARVRVQEVNEELQLDLPEDEAYDTLGGYVFSKLGRIPKVGERFVDNGVEVEIVEAGERSVGRVRITLQLAAKGE